MVLISKFAIPKGYIGLTVFPFIFLKYEHLKSDTILMNHERIHLRQQLEFLILPFFLIYTTEFLIRLIVLRNWKRAYRSISFEKEAYANERNLTYLKSRPFWSFLTYL